MVRAVGLVLVLVALAVLTASAYTVSETEQVVLTQFGKPVGDAVSAPGLHWKLPFVQKVHRFDKRWLEWDGGEAEMPTREKTFITVDAYARWRVVDPLRFYTSVGNETVAQTRLDAIINSAVRSVVASHDLIEVVRLSNRRFDKISQTSETTTLEERDPLPNVEVGRERLAQLVLEKAAEASPDLGIEIVDVQFQRVSYTASVRAKVFDRMVAERQRIAARYRSEGEGKRAEILGKKERELKRIESEAYRKAEEIKGRGDARATATYGAAHGLDPSFYKMLQSLESYQATIDDDTVLILSTESDYFEPLSGKR